MKKLSSCVWRIKSQSAHVKSSLKEQVMNGIYNPEIYVYPPPRSYTEMEDFDIGCVDFSNEANLYVHIPFCQSVCDFCGYVKITDDEEIRERYVDCVVKEIDMYEEIISSRDVIRTLHIGGGTPSLLRIDQMEKILDKLACVKSDIYDTCEEISIESTPSIVVNNKEYFKHLLDNLGFNRVSLGIQSLDEKEIRSARRSNNPSISIEALEIIRDLGCENIVVDLMIGLEGQTKESFENTVLKLLEFGPDCVEIYGLGVMPNTCIGKSKEKRSKSMIKRVDDIYECCDLARELFLSSGYYQQCHNRYAIEGRGSFLQEDFVFEDQSLIGFGAGTRSYCSNIHYRNHYFPNNHKKSIMEYMNSMEASELAVSSGIILSEEEKLRQYCVYNIEEFDLKDFRERFGMEFVEIFGEIYEDMKELEVLDEVEERENGVLKLNDKGLNLRDLICYNFFSDYCKNVEHVYRPKEQD